MGAIPSTGGGTLQTAQIYDVCYICSWSGHVHGRFKSRSASSHLSSEVAIEPPDKDIHYHSFSDWLHVSLFLLEVLGKSLASAIA
jgi:hypothetical protein